LIGRLFRRRPPRPAREEAEPPYDEPAFVPRRPRSSPSSGAAVLELPEEPQDTDARGRESA
jgi:hypothetical protein